MIQSVTARASVYTISERRLQHIIIWVTAIQIDEIKLIIRRRTSIAFYTTNKIQNTTTWLTVTLKIDATSTIRSGTMEGLSKKQIDELMNCTICILHDGMNYMNQRLLDQRSLTTYIVNGVKFMMTQWLIYESFSIKQKKKLTLEWERTLIKQLGISSWQKIIEGLIKKQIYEFMN